MEGYQIALSGGKHVDVRYPTHDVTLQVCGYHTRGAGKATAVAMLCNFPASVQSTMPTIKRCSVITSDTSAQHWPLITDERHMHISGIQAKGRVANPC